MRSVIEQVSAENNPHEGIETMKKTTALFRALCAAWLLTSLAFVADLRAQSDDSCPAPFALCSAANCKEIPGTIEVSKYAPSRGEMIYLYPVAECECEVITSGSGLADLSMMGGSCNPPIFQESASEAVDGIWSLYSDQNEDTVMECSDPDGRYAQCFSYACVYDEDDPTQAICTCPIEFGEFTTSAGDCQQASCGDQLMVGGPSDNTVTCDDSPSDR